jgi:hypothetical protein
MKMNVFYATALSCFLVIGQTYAQSGEILGMNKKSKVTALKSEKMDVPVHLRFNPTRLNYLPTEVWRDYTDMDNILHKPEIKFEYQYDEFGHIISENQYELNVSNGEYNLTEHIVREFHRLPNGEFVKTGEETSNSRYTSAYDSKGLQLGYQLEIKESGQWVLYVRSEAVLIGNGIRTGIRNYNFETQTMETDNSYTFDEKGRIIRYEWDEDNWETYEWNDADRIIGFAIHSDETDAAYTNITFAYNGEYFNPYSLSPLSNGVSYFEYAGEDYSLHQLYIDANVTFNGASGVAHTTISTTPRIEIVFRTILENDTIATTTFTQTDENGSYSIVEEYIDGWEETAKEYNAYGDLIRDYNNAKVITYDREYDAASYPLKTICRGDNSFGSSYEETYTAWVGTGNAPLPPSYSVYPNPASDVLNVSGMAGATLTVIDLQGRTVYVKRSIDEKESIAVSAWTKGLYIISLQRGTTKYVNKVIIR